VCRVIRFAEKEASRIESLDVDAEGIFYWYIIASPFYIYIDQSQTMK